MKKIMPALSLAIFSLAYTSCKQHNTTAAGPGTSGLTGNRADSNGRTNDTNNVNMINDSTNNNQLNTADSNFNVESKGNSLRAQLS